MKLAAILTTYNRADLITQAVQSVLNQSRLPDEIIVVDDGSTDETADQLQPYLKRIRYIRQHRRGVSTARNRGIQSTDAEWLAFLDSDDLWMRDKIKIQQQVLSQYPAYRICYTNEAWRKHGKWINQKKKHRKYSGYIYEKCLPLCIISPSSVMIHRSIFKRVGEFDEELPACEDYDMWLRICSQFPALYIDQRLIVKRAGDWKQLSQQHSLDRYRIIALRNMLRHGHLTQKMKRQTLSMLAEKCRIYRIGCQKHHRYEQVEWVDAVVESFGLSHAAEKGNSTV